MMRITTTVSFVLATLSTAPIGRATAQVDAVIQAPNVSLVLATARRFHELLASGDSAAAAKLLAPDVVIVESGFVETRSEYLAHHMGADIEFAKSVPAERLVVSVKRRGDIAWIVSTSTAKGRFREREIESRGAELMVLGRSSTGVWLIRAVHWSSRPRSSQ